MISYLRYEEIVKPWPHRETELVIGKSPHDLRNFRPTHRSVLGQCPWGDGWSQALHSCVWAHGRQIASLTSPSGFFPPDLAFQVSIETVLGMTLLLGISTENTDLCKNVIIFYSACINSTEVILKPFFLFLLSAAFCLLFLVGPVWASCGGEAPHLLSTYCVPGVVLRCFYTLPNPRFCPYFPILKRRKLRPGEFKSFPGSGA